MPGGAQAALFFYNDIGREERVTPPALSGRCACGQATSVERFLVSNNLPRFAGLYSQWQRMRPNWKPASQQHNCDTEGKAMTALETTRSKSV